MKEMKALQYLTLTLALMLAYFLSAKAVAADDADMIVIQEFGSESFENSNDESLSLLNWYSPGKKRENPVVAYNRLKHFGKWATFKKSKSCFDVRAQVLIRDSLVRPTSTDDKPCTIEKGEWLDTYTGKIIFNDDEIQIDHMVPLKEAYVAGAHAWPAAKRCVYANFLGMKDHLIVASNFENQSKSDQTPKDYMPPRAKYKCTYLKSWLKVKTIWQLSMTAAESSAIRSLIKENECDEMDFMISKNEIAEIRKTAKDLEKYCPVPRTMIRKLPSIANTRM